MEHSLAMDIAVPLAALSPLLLLVILTANKQIK